MSPWLYWIKMESSTFNMEVDRYIKVQAPFEDNMINTHCGFENPALQVFPLHWFRAILCYQNVNIEASSSTPSLVDKMKPAEVTLSTPCSPGPQSYMPPGRPKMPDTSMIMKISPSNSHRKDMPPSRPTILPPEQMVTFKHVQDFMEMIKIAQAIQVLSDPGINSQAAETQDAGNHQSGNRERGLRG